MEEKPNIVIVLVDCLRFDYVGFFNPKSKITPNIDRIASEGAAFECCISSAPWTKSSISSLFTSVQPIKHGVYGRPNLLPSSLKTMAQAALEAGYSTLGFCENVHLRPNMGFSKGFEKYFWLKYGPVRTLALKVLRRLTFGNTREDMRMALYWPGCAEMLSRKLLKTVGKAKKPFFSYIHYLDTHRTYGIPEYRLKKELGSVGQIKKVYSDRVKQVDKVIGSLESELRKKHKPYVLVILADHGEEFMEHGRIHHPQDLYDELLHVPLVIKCGGKIPATRVKNQVRTIDIMPTLFELVGIPIPKDIDGISLVPLINGKDNSDRLAFSEAGILDGAEYVVSIRTKKFKLIKNVSQEKFEFYDLEKDPHEQNNLSSEQGVKFIGLKKKLEEYIGKRKQNVGTKMREGPDTMERLKGMGYL